MNEEYQRKEFWDDFPLKQRLIRVKNTIKFFKGEHLVQEWTLEEFNKLYIVRNQKVYLRN